MQMRFFKPKVKQPQSIVDYLKTNFEVMAKDIHPLDQIELHKQTREMVYSTLTRKAMMAHRLENSLNNTTAQLQLERASSHAKDDIIKSLEWLVIGLGHNLKDVKATEALIKKKYEDIVALRKQLKLLPLRHPQTTKVIQKKSEEELMDLLFKLNEQFKETEQELEKSLKSRQSESSSQPQKVIPMVSTVVQSTLATTLAPNVPLATAETITGTTQAETSGQSTEELINSMEEMKLQVSELQKVKEKFVTSEQKYDVSKINFTEGGKINAWLNR